MITETLQDVSSSETHHEGYFCTTKSWRKLKKLAIAEWVEEKNKKSENKHISPQVCPSQYSNLSHCMDILI